jgi:hypothetical protein
MESGGGMSKGDCVCCGKPARYTIQLAVGPSHNDLTRYYIPNDFAREAHGGYDPIEEVPFCAACMRPIEDNLRATIGYLQSEAGKSPERWADR